MQETTEEKELKARLKLIMNQRRLDEEAEKQIRLRLDRIQTDRYTSKALELVPKYEKYIGKKVVIRQGQSAFSFLEVSDIRPPVGTYSMWLLEFVPTTKVYCYNTQFTMCNSVVADVGDSWFSICTVNEFKECDSKRIAKVIDIANNIKKIICGGQEEKDDVIKRHEQSILWTFQHILDWLTTDQESYKTALEKFKASLYNNFD